MGERCTAVRQLRPGGVTCRTLDPVEDLPSRRRGGDTEGGGARPFLFRNTLPSPLGDFPPPPDPPWGRLRRQDEHGSDLEGECPAFLPCAG